MKLNNGKCYLPITFDIQFLGVILYAPNAVPPMAARMNRISIILSQVQQGQLQ
jgi:hypothetical protein